MDEIVFTPAGLLDLLSQIDELSSVDIGVTETLDGKLQVIVGNSIYILDTKSIESLPTDSEVVQQLNEISEDTYSDLSSSGDYIDNSPISSGVIGELAKTLLVGGMARLTAKYLKD